MKFLGYVTLWLEKNLPWTDVVREDKLVFDIQQSGRYRYGAKLTIASVKDVICS